MHSHLGPAQVPRDASFKARPRERATCQCALPAPSGVETSPRLKLLRLWLRAGGRASWAICVCACAAGKAARRRDWSR
jgi:hypothetical protein